MTLIPDFFSEKNSITDALELKVYENNAGGFKRSIRAVVYPSSHEEVEKTIQWANENKVALYPISTGKNWGMGSKVPVINDCIVVNFSKMNRIIEINADHDYAVIEPGVTQQQLYSYLQKNDLPYIFNVTGSSAHTSIIGNSLERGVGYFSSRVENLRALKVVMGNGKTIQTGFAHYENARTKGVYSYGVGPDITGLFFQSNYGIVTQATFDLIPKREIHAILMCGLTDEKNYENYINELAQLRKQEIITTAFHIANRNRSAIALLPHVESYFKNQLGMNADQAKRESAAFHSRITKDTWSAFGGVMGSRKEVRLAKKTIKRKMKKYGKVMFLTQKKISRLQRVVQLFSFLPYFKKLKAFTVAMEAAFSYSQGIPSDMALDSVYWPVNEPIPPNSAEDMDSTDAGLLFSLPILPLNGSSLKKAAQATVEIFRNYGFEAYITFNIIDSKSIESVINLAFKKSDLDTFEKAKKAIDELNAYFMKEGFILYRTDIDRMGQVIGKNDSFWVTIKELKTIFDPNGIISPGRYNMI
ncbi:MAG: FAD-binding oxidoreductase [Cyclobacteriaceae bacterium]|nr:FAD-binding oxidoreductase [Cyclobacteriaceae bacterium]